MSEDLFLTAARGRPGGLVIPGEELFERFSRSSGPGGQGVNTTDSRVELSWKLSGSSALTDAQRQQLEDRFGGRLVDGVLTIAASEHRSQRQNRTAARARLATLIGDGLTPSTLRRPTRPSRSSTRRRLDAKTRRGDLKSGRRRPDAD